MLGVLSGIEQSKQPFLVPVAVPVLVPIFQAMTGPRFSTGGCQIWQHADCASEYRQYWTFRQRPPEGSTRPLKSLNHPRLPKRGSRPLAGASRPLSGHAWLRAGCGVWDGLVITRPHWAPEGSRRPLNAAFGPDVPSRALRPLPGASGGLSGLARADNP